MTKDDRRSWPAYTIAEAAHCLRLKRSTLHSWVRGYSYPVQGGQGQAHPLLTDVKVLDGTTYLSFLNLVEGNTIKVMRTVHRLTMQRIRSALSYVSTELRVRSPLLSQDFYTDGVDLLVKAAALDDDRQEGRSPREDLIYASQGGQLAMKEVLDLALSRIEHDDAGMPISLFPFPKKTFADTRKIIQVNPEIAFGKPTVIHSGVSVDMLVSRFTAGDSMALLAEDYGLSMVCVEQVIQCEFDVARAAA